MLLHLEAFWGLETMVLVINNFYLNNINDLVFHKTWKDNFYRYIKHPQNIPTFDAKTETFC